MVLVAKASKRPGCGDTLDTFAFVSKATIEQLQTTATATTALPPSAFCFPVATPAPAAAAPAPATLPGGWSILEDEVLLSAICRLGEPEPLPLAATKAFEQCLKEASSAWGTEEASRLSIDFLVAFGAELGPRLDVHHRLRSARLSDDALRRLTSPPLSAYVQRGVLEAFQTLPPATDGALIATNGAGWKAAGTPAATLTRGAQGPEAVAPSPTTVAIAQTVGTPSPSLHPAAALLPAPSPAPPPSPGLPALPLFTAQQPVPAPTSHQLLFTRC